MNFSQDYEDLFKILNAHKIRYLVVGAYAVIYHSEPRYTKDLDVWVIPEMNDCRKVFDALKKFGAPLHGLEPQDFKDKKIILQMGVPPVRIDIMIHVPGISFQSAWKNKKKTKYGKTPIHVLGLSDLIQSKKTAGRPQDLMDIDRMALKRKLKKN